MAINKQDLIQDVKEYISLIEAANSKSSDTRNAYIEAANEILSELRAADDSDIEVLEKLEEQYTTLDDAAQFLQNQALIQWSTNYADFIEELGNFSEGRKTPIHGFAIKSWFIKTNTYARKLGLLKAGQSDNSVKNITDELRELYIIILMQRVDRRLALESVIRLKRLENVGFLTSEDLPNLSLIVL